jgi:hypothetical protein
MNVMINTRRSLEDYDRWGALFRDGDDGDSRRR